MDRYTAGYTDIFGVSHELATANTLDTLYERLTGSAAEEDAANRDDIMYMIRKKFPETTSAWIREAPLRLVVELQDPEEEPRSLTYGCFTSLEEVVTYLILNTPSLRDYPDTVYKEAGYAAISSVVVDGQVCDYYSETQTVTVEDPEELTVAGVLALAHLCYGRDLEEEENKGGTALVSINLYQSDIFRVTNSHKMATRAEADLKQAVRSAYADGVPQATLARLAGVSQPTIGRWVK